MAETGVAKAGGLVAMVAAAAIVASSAAINFLLSDAVVKDGWRREEMDGRSRYFNE